MRLEGWEKVGSAEEYREMVKAEYYRLQEERSVTQKGVGLDEVKLRLFLSLLDKPGSEPIASSNSSSALSM